jgi:hypothetical protein
MTMRRPTGVVGAVEADWVSVKLAVPTVIVADRTALPVCAATL